MNRIMVCGVHCHQGDANCNGYCQGKAYRANPLDLMTEISAERRRQDAEWGGPAHDDQHDIATFVQLIEDYAGWARVMAGMGSLDKARNRLVQVAALAIAACESIDRRLQGRTVIPR